MAQQKIRGDRRFPILPMLLAAAVGAGGAYYVLEPETVVSAVKDQALRFGLMPGCNIKGNISINSGEHIYHMPGQEYYSATRIRPEYGERWFCSESDARRAGWRKARN